MSRDVVDLLKDLPPDLPHPADRVVEVRTRVRRRQVRGAAGAALAVAAVAVTAGLAWGGGPDGRAIDPAATTSPSSDGPTWTEVADPQGFEGAGTTTLDLGAPPAAADAVRVRVQCLDVGRFSTDGGGGLDCTAEPVDEVSGTWSTRLDRIDPHAFTITAEPGARWRLTATYVRTR